MNVLIVFAHPKPYGSFNHAVLKEFTRGLEDGKHQYEIVDLYRIGFDPVFRQQDYAFFANKSIPENVLEAMDWKRNVPIASSEGPLGFIKKPIAERMVRNQTLEETVRMVAKNKPKDVLEQQKKVEWADGIALISPVIWMHLPTIMKGWLTRVFQYGFAYALEPEGWAGDSGGRIMLSKLDKVLRMNSTFFTEEDYRSKGWYDAMAKLIDEWHLRYVGVKKVETVYFYAVGAVSEDNGNCIQSLFLVDCPT